MENEFHCVGCKPTSNTRSGIPLWVVRTRISRCAMKNMDTLVGGWAEIAFPPSTDKKWISTLESDLSRGMSQQQASACSSLPSRAADCESVCDVQMARVIRHKQHKDIGPIIDLKQKIQSVNRRKNLKTTARNTMDLK